MRFSKLGSAAAALVLAGSLAACGDAGEQATDTPEADAA